MTAEPIADSLPARQWLERHVWNLWRDKVNTHDMVPIINRQPNGPYKVTEADCANTLARLQDRVYESKRRAAR